MATGPVPATFALNDIAGPTFKEAFRRQRRRPPTMLDIQTMSPVYIPFGCAASEESLERMGTPVLRGKTPQRLYEEWAASLPAGPGRMC
jgi:hypothetical protein